MSFFVHDTAVVDQPCKIGENTKVWHFSHIMQNVQIGNNCVLGQNTFVASQVTIGNGVKIQNNVSIYEGIDIKDHVFIGPSVVFTNVINPRSEIDRKTEFLNTKIEKGATIGANSTIVCGVTIGKYAFVAAGAVVTKDIDDFSLVMGNPAIHAHWVDRFGNKLHFVNHKAISGNLLYTLQNGKVKEVRRES